MQPRRYEIGHQECPASFPARGEPQFRNPDAQGTESSDPVVLINHSNRKLTVKVVYVGPEASGKSTNLVALHQSLGENVVGRLLSLTTAQDPKVYFDLLPVDLGNLKGYTVRLQVCTVPGRQSQRATRQLVAKGADGLVFVADSQPTRLQANLDSYSDLQQIQEDLSLQGIPLVVQYNKRDLPGSLPIPDLTAALGFDAMPFVEAVASQPRGVVETFRLISRLAFIDAVRRITPAAAGLSGLVHEDASGSGGKSDPARSRSGDSPGAVTPPPRKDDIVESTGPLARKRLTPSISDVLPEVSARVKAEPSSVFRAVRKVVAEELDAVRQGLAPVTANVLVEAALRMLHQEASGPGEECHPGKGAPPSHLPSLCIAEDWATEWGEDQFGVFIGFRIGGADYRFRWISESTFARGSRREECGRHDNEAIGRTVALTHGFWIGETPCTQALWRSVMGPSPSRFQTPDRPVENVSWDDCQDFLVRLERMVPGLRARLPTEEEWECACRGGTDTATWRGDLEIHGERNAPVLDPIAWYGGNSGWNFELENGVDSSEWPEKEYPHFTAGTRPVRRKAPNPFGLFDMLGNVYEWCSNPYAPPSGPTPCAEYTDSPHDANDPNMVIRGGCWASPAADVRAASRSFEVRSYKDDDVGFRLARSEAPLMISFPVGRHVMAPRFGMLGYSADSLQRPHSSGLGLATSLPDPVSVSWSSREGTPRRVSAAQATVEPPFRYELQDELGRGTLSVVYKALDRTLNRLVAVKLLSPVFGDTDVPHFRMEAKALAALDHPNIVRLYDFGFGGVLGSWFLAMEFLEGGTLQSIWKSDPERIHRNWNDYFRQAARAVASAHFKGILHRNIKPSKLILDGHGTLRLAGFSLACPDGEAAPERLIGTPAFFPPEALRGLAYCPASDVYSLGASFYALATGRPPYVGDDALVARLERDPEDARVLAPFLSVEEASILMRSLARNPLERYQNGGEVLGALVG